MGLRSKFWNYNGSGIYFVTLVCENRIQHFSKIKDQKNYLTESGLEIEKIWKEIPEKFPLVSIDDYIVMPDHFHGIIIFKKNDDENKDRKEKLVNYNGVSNKSISNKNSSLSNVIRWFKGRSTFEIRKFNHLFKWSEGFHDNIIFDKRQLFLTRRYIKLNPIRWKN
jgi:REP element-mobilizing transposase RayT